MTAAAPTSQMLSELTQFAYRLGVVFGGEAERADTHERRMECYNLFDRCFFSVRVATGLQLRLRQAGPGSRLGSERQELRERADASDRDTQTARDRDPAERDRDRESASFPLLLKTLQGVAADAANLPGPPHAALPGLRELLAQITAAPAPAATPPKSAVGLRARLATSATAPTLTFPPPTGPTRPALGLPIRRATGPPRR